MSKLEAKVRTNVGTLGLRIEPVVQLDPMIDPRFKEAIARGKARPFTKEDRLYLESMGYKYKEDKNG